MDDLVAKGSPSRLAAIPPCPTTQFAGTSRNLVRVYVAEGFALDPEREATASRLGRIASQTASAPALNRHQSGRAARPCRTLAHVARGLPSQLGSAGGPHVLAAGPYRSASGSP